MPAPTYLSEACKETWVDRCPAVSDWSPGSRCTMPVGHAGEHKYQVKRCSEVSVYHNDKRCELPEGHPGDHQHGDYVWLPSRIPGRECVVGRAIGLGQLFQPERRRDLMLEYLTRDLPYPEPVADLVEVAKGVFEAKPDRCSSRNFGKRCQASEGHDGLHHHEGMWWGGK